MKKSDKIYNYIGHKIFVFRKRKKMTQDQLAKKINLQRTSIVNIESGTQRITVANLYLISDILNVDIKDLMPSMKLIYKNK